LTEGLTRDAAHRYYLDGAGPMPSVTTVTKTLSTGDALVGWAKRETAACAIRNLDVLSTMVKDGGPASAQSWLQSIPDFQRDTAADLGSRVHALAEATVRGEDVELTADETPFVESYRAWLAEIRPEFIVLEEMVCSTTHGYAGTLDAIAWIDGERWLLDIKTGKACYPEMGMQLVAYARADFIGRAADPIRYTIPAVTRFGVIHVRPDRSRLVEYTSVDDYWSMFLSCLELYRRKGGLSAGMGEWRRSAAAA
jgi:hypothetical protein